MILKLNSIASFVILFRYTKLGEVLGLSTTMNLVWLVSILLICGQGSIEAASRPAVVNVGAMFAAGSINGRVLKIAIEAARNDVNSDPSILRQTKLSISFHNSNYSGFLGLVGGKFFFLALCFYYKNSLCSMRISIYTYVVENALIA